MSGALSFADPRGGTITIPAGNHDGVLAAAARAGVRAPLLVGLAWKESSFDPTAVRPEPTFPYLWDCATGKPTRDPASVRGPAGVPAATELWQQRASWGLCQVMGATARFLGFRGAFLSALCHPDIGLELGARYLASLLRRMDESDALSAYNAGAPTSANLDTYVRPILTTSVLYERAVS